MKYIILVNQFRSKGFQQRNFMMSDLGYSVGSIYIPPPNILHCFLLNKHDTFFSSTPLFLSSWLAAKQSRIGVVRLLSKLLLS